MKLTKRECQKVDEVLSILKKQLSVQLRTQMGEDKKKIDNAFVRKLANTYLTEEGFSQILQDTGLVTGAGRDCGCAGPCYTTCASPCKNSMTGVG